MLHRRSIKTANLKKKNRNRLYGRSVVLAILTIVVIGGLGWVSKLPSLQVTKVLGEGNALVTENELWETISAETEGNYLYLFSKRNSFLFPKSQVLAAVATRFPIFDGAKIDLEGLNTIRIQVSERKPAALWCKGVRGGEGDCYFLDAHGYIYSEAPEFKGVVYVRYYGELKAENPIGNVFLSRERFIAIAHVVEEIDTLGLEAATVVMGEFGDYEMSLQAGGKLFFNESEDVDKTLINLQTVLEENGKAKGMLPPIDYIDLRFGNKVFYKFR